MFTTSFPGPMPFLVGCVAGKTSILTRVSAPSRNAPIGPWACFEQKNPPYPVTSETSRFPYQTRLSFHQLVSNHRPIDQTSPTRKWGSGSKSTFGSPDRPLKISSEMQGMHATSVKFLHAFADNSFLDALTSGMEISNLRLSWQLRLESECRAFWGRF